MRASLLLVLVAIISSALSRGAADVYRRAATDPAYLQSKLSAWQQLTNSAPWNAAFEAGCNAGALENRPAPPQPVFGEPWTLWNQSYYMTGTSYFTLRSYGEPAFLVGPLPFVQLVDVENQIWFNSNPLAVQLTIYNSTFEVFDFEVPGATEEAFTCFVNATAGFVNQATVHNEVITYNVNVETTVEVNVTVGHKTVTIDYTEPTAFSFGIANEAGGGNYAGMAFSSFTRLSDGMPIYWAFDQPGSSAKNPPGPDVCAHSNSLAGGSYDCTKPGSSVGPYRAPPLAQFVATFLSAPCCNNGNCALGISTGPQVLDYNTYLCIN